MSDFFDMGGYAGYVWSSFGLCFLVLIINVVSARQKLKSTQKLIAGQIKRNKRIQSR